MSGSRIAIVGAGAWGSALAQTIGRAGREVTLIARNPKRPGVLRMARDSVAGHDVVLLAVPAQSLRDAASFVAAGIDDGIPVVACAKGIETDSLQTMSELAAEILPDYPVAVLSGPSIAAEVARGLPTAVTLAAGDAETAAALALALGSATFRIYHTSDIRGVEIGGAAKNVLAIAVGIVAGRALGASAAAALITRGFAELFRFGAAYGARPETLTGLSGLGDLVLTCSSAQSRNYSYGIALGKGDPQPAGSLAEGVFTAPVLVEMAKAKGIDMPIAHAVADVLAKRMTVDEAIGSLLNRPFKAEA
jgi:glycerol-3-phosphate dehydrogenase (NAD(P)+)